MKTKWEMSIEDWIDEHSISIESDGVVDNYVHVDNVYKLFFEDTKKPKVYPYVAKWFDEHGSKDSWWNWIYRWGKSKYSEEANELEQKVYHWFIDFNENNFVDMFRYGYEVIQEQRYYVINNEKYFLLRKHQEQTVPTLLRMENVRKDMLELYRLTEEQIVSYDKTYMEFAKKEEKLELG